ncbi:MAG: hypothetical protein KDD89_10450 [Anaerolineales bacterium]|nr:hypothetical protein [Anaerolineales bacterium]
MDSKVRNVSLNSARVAITNAQADPQVQANLALFGYDAAKLTEGSALLSEAETLTQQQAAEYGEQFAASEAVRTAWAEAKLAYGRSLKVARVAFRQDAQAQAALLLNGTRKESLSGWLQQATTFYANLLADARLVGGMGQFGYDEAKLTAEQGLVTAVQSLDAAQEREKGEAQAATKARDGKLDDLAEWLADFREIAAVALADEPQQLERLGLGAIA